MRGWYFCFAGRITRGNSCLKICLQPKFLNIFVSDHPNGPVHSYYNFHENQQQLINCARTYIQLIHQINQT